MGPFQIRNLLSAPRTPDWNYILVPNRKISSLVGADHLIIIIIIIITTGHQFQHLWTF